MTQKTLFDGVDCDYASRCSIEAANKELKPKLREMWVGIFLFPTLWLVFICILISNEIEITLEPALSGFLIMSFFSYIIWSGSEKTRTLYRKRITMGREALKNLMYIENLIKNKKNYILYLRDYTNGVTPHTTRDVKMPSIVGGYESIKTEGSLRLEKITQYLEPHFPIVMLHNSRDRTYKYSGHILFCTDKLWFDNFKNLAKNATLVVLDYAGNFEESPAIISEIEFIKKNQLSIIVVGNNNELNKLKDLGLSFTKNSSVSIEIGGRKDGFIVRNEVTEKILIPDALEKFIRDIKSV